MLGSDRAKINIFSFPITDSMPAKLRSATLPIAIPLFSKRLTPLVIAITLPKSQFHLC